MDTVAVFDRYRSLLFSIAYRMLGSVMDAEDMVQEAFLRWQSADTSEVEKPKSFLTTVVTRLSIDHLRSARVQREEYIGEWLPEPLIADPYQPAPIDNLMLSESVSMAFLVLLESLTPIERAVFLLREVFEYDYAEIARMVDKSEANCRKIFQRAQQHIEEEKPRYEVDSDIPEEWALQFLHTAQAGDVDGMLAFLAKDVIVYSDGGGVVSAARHPIVGPNNVARFFAGLGKKLMPHVEPRPMVVNNRPGIVWYLEGKAYAAISADVVDGKIVAMRIVVNPEKLEHILPNSSSIKEDDSTILD